MKEIKKDDFNVSCDLRRQFQRAVLISKDFRTEELNTMSLVVSMFFDGMYSTVNSLYAEYGVVLNIERVIPEILNTKELYEEILKKKYPFDDQNESEEADVANSEDNEKAEDDSEITENDKKNALDLLQNIQIVFTPQSEKIDYEVYYSKNLKRAIIDAGERCRQNGQDYIDEENLLYSIFNLEDCSAKRFLEHYNNIFEEAFDLSIDIIDLNETLISNYNIHFSSFENKVIIPKPIENCCRNLNDKYTKGVVCDILGRDNEIEKVWSILSKKQKSNAVLLGEAGVGKSAIVEAITMSIVNETCPKDFIGYTVVELNVSSMVAGTKYRGEFEKKIEYFINFIESNEKLIIFVDELHHMVGAGSAEGSGPDLSGSLKPLLARDKVKFIGATTMDEYIRYICRDNAFRRRLETVIVKEPKNGDVLPMLKVKIENLKKYHGVGIKKGELEYIKLCASCFNTSTANPDKTLDLIDTSMAIAKNENAKFVRRSHIEKVFRDNYQKFDKLSEEFKLSTAYHEIGHFIINKHYEDILVDEKVYAISIIPGFNFLGVNILESTEILVGPDTSYIEAEIATLIAGRIAEELYTGKKSSGASNDLRRATAWARNMILKYGISSQEEFSDIYLFDEGGENDIPLTEEAVNKVNKEAKEVIEKIYHDTTEIIRGKWDIVKELVDYLMKNKIVSADELNKFFK